MLHTQAVSKELLELLNKVVKSEALADFYLVGGTALALQIGHRLSADLDFFGDCDLEELEITNILNRFNKVRIIKKSENILIYTVGSIKVDFVNYHYKWLSEPIVEDGIKLASMQDIGAMKLNAIAGRGSKKDFIDLHFLLERFSLRELIDFYKEKYPDGSEFLVLKSLNYFEDAELQEMPKMLIPVGWEEIKSDLKIKIQTFLRS